MKVNITTPRRVELRTLPTGAVFYWPINNECVYLKTGEDPCSCFNLTHSWIGGPVETDLVVHLPDACLVNTLS